MGGAMPPKNAPPPPPPSLLPACFPLTDERDAQAAPPQLARQGQPRRARAHDDRVQRGRRGGPRVGRQGREEAGQRGLGRVRLCGLVRVGSGGERERVGETAEGVGGGWGGHARTRQPPIPHTTPHSRAQTTQHAHTWRRTQAASPPPARVAASASGDDGGGMSGCFDGERAVRGGVLVVVVAEGGAKPSRPDRPGVGGAARLGGRAGRAGGPVACGDGAGRASRICVFT